MSSLISSSSFTFNFFFFDEIISNSCITHERVLSFHNLLRLPACIQTKSFSTRLDCCGVGRSRHDMTMKNENLHFLYYLLSSCTFSKEPEQWWNTSSRSKKSWRRKYEKGKSIKHTFNIHTSKNSNHFGNLWIIFSLNEEHDTNALEIHEIFHFCVALFSSGKSSRLSNVTSIICTQTSSLWKIGIFSFL